MASYICANCGKKVNSTITHEEAMEECQKKFSPAEINSEGLAIVCSECYEMFMEYLRAHPEMRVN